MSTRFDHPSKGQLETSGKSTCSTYHQAGPGPNTFATRPRARSSSRWARTYRDCAARTASTTAASATEARTRETKAPAAARIATAAGSGSATRAKIGIGEKIRAAQEGNSPADGKAAAAADSTGSTSGSSDTGLKSATTRPAPGACSTRSAPRMGAFRSSRGKKTRLAL